MRRAQRQRKYLNAILTANAALLAALVWSNIAGAPMGATAGAAPQALQPPPAAGQGVPDAGMQQLQIINEIKNVRSDLAHLQTALTNGKLRVMVGNLNEVKLDIDYVKLRDVMKQQQP